MTTLEQAQAKNQVAFVVPDAAKARVEIDELLGDNELTNLYLLALEEMQKEDATKSVAKRNEDWWTFYSLSGIHGQPSEDWNGIRNPLGVLGGYCTHGDLLFPTWHRLYANMLEQALTIKIKKIAAQFTTEPEKSLYQSAAARFRIPFWDPFLPRNPITNPLTRGVWGFPKILTTPKIWVKRPNQTDLDSIPNPLYAYVFPNDILKEKGRTPISWPRDISPQGKIATVRSPSSNGDTSVSQLEANLRSQIPSLGTNLWKLLSRYADPGAPNKNDLRTWTSFSTHNQIDPRTDRPILDSRGRPIPHGDTTVSLESWHDNIHGLIGTGDGWGGHMGNPAFAGFDPIFWLLHTNCDRLLAIFQALYPDKWMRSRTANTNLYPFQKSDTTYWTSADVKDWKTLGYAIPGNQELDAQGQTALETHLSEYYNWVTSGASRPPASVSANWPRDLSGSVALHGSQAKQFTPPILRFEALQQTKLMTRTVSLQDSAEGPAQVTVQDEPKNIAVADVAADTVANPPETIEGGSTLTWNARIRVKKFAYDGPFNLHLFIGYIKESQPERFISKKNEVGFSHIFATNRHSPCANCKQQRAEGIIYEDIIPISHALYAYLRSNKVPETDGPLFSLRTLDDFTPENVVPFLKANLKWVITDTASNILGDVQQMKDSHLEIAVSARKFDLPTPQAPLGVYYPPKTYEEITRDKVGGAGYGSPAGVA